MRKLGLARFLMKVLAVLPGKYPIISPNQDFHQPFFIFGSGRNGSTLLNVMLNQHSKIFLPPEQYFLGNSIIKFRLYNYLLWRDLVKIIYGELIKETGSHSWNFSPDKVILEAMNFIGKERSLQALILHIYNSYAQSVKPDFKLWGDSTPFNTRFIPEIYRCFPKAKYAFLIRNGLDVVAAYKKAGDITEQQLNVPVNACDHWEKSIIQYDWLKKRTNVHLLKYEDLVSNPEAELTKLLAHLDLEFEQNMLDFHNNVPSIAEYNESHHRNLHKPLNAGSIGQWSRFLEKKEIEQMPKNFWKTMSRFDYQKA